MSSCDNRLTNSGRHGHGGGGNIHPLGGSTVTWNTQGADTRQGTLGSDDQINGGDSTSLFHHRTSRDIGDDYNYDRYRCR